MTMTMMNFTDIRASAAEAIMEPAGEERRIPT